MNNLPIVPIVKELQQCNEMIQGSKLNITSIDLSLSTFFNHINSTNINSIIPLEWMKEELSNQLDQLHSVQSMISQIISESITQLNKTADFSTPISYIEQAPLISSLNNKQESVTSNSINGFLLFICCTILCLFLYGNKSRKNYFIFRETIGYKFFIPLLFSIVIIPYLILRFIYFSFIACCSKLKFREVKDECMYIIEGDAEGATVIRIGTDTYHKVEHICIQSRYNLHNKYNSNGIHSNGFNNEYVSNECNSNQNQFNECESKDCNSNEL